MPVYAQAFLQTRAGDCSIRRIQLVAIPEGILGHTVDHVARDQIAQSRRSLAVLSLVPTHSLLQQPDIPFGEDFFHPLRQRFAHPFVAGLLRESLEEFEGRVRIAAFNRHPRSQPGEILRCARE
jgi:hypothetical protein